MEPKFTVGFQNIEEHGGVVCKIDDIKSGLSNDIEILVENWWCNCGLTFDDYTPHYVSPQKHQWVKKERFSYLDQEILIKKFQNFEDIK